MDTNILKNIIPVFKRYDVSRAGIFGSYARNEQNKKSDIDFAVEMKKNATLFDFSALRRELSDSLKMPVDLVTYNSLNSRIKNHIMKDMITIYEKKRTS